MGAGSLSGFDGQLWARIGARKPLVRIVQGRPAYGQDSNLSVIHPWHRSHGRQFAAMDCQPPAYCAPKSQQGIAMGGRKPGLVPRARRRRTPSAFPGCQSRARPHFGAVGPSGGTVYTSDLKSAAERLTGSSPVLGTTTRNRPHGWCGLFSRCRDK